MIIEGVHQGIVSEYLFNKVQLVLSGSRQQKNMNVEHGELPLRGFITCSVCGKVMTGSRSRGHNEVGISIISVLLLVNRDIRLET